MPNINHLWHYLTKNLGNKLYKLLITVLIFFYSIEVVYANPIDFCSLNKIEISPDGKSALFWRKPNISIGDRSASDPSAIFGYINSNDNDVVIKSVPLVKNKSLHISAVQWYKTSNKVAIINNGSILYSLETGRIKSGPIDNESLSTETTELDIKETNLTFQTYANENLRLQLQNLRLKPQNGSSYNSHTSIFYFDNKLMWLKSQSSYEILQIEKYFDEITAVETNLSDENQKLFTNVALGSNNAIVSYANLNQDKPIPFGKPIYNLVNGKIVGWFSPDKVSIDDITDKKLQILTSDKINLDVSFNGQGIAILRGNGFGNIEAILINENTSRTIPICKQRKLLSGNNNIHKNALSREIPATYDDISMHYSSKILFDGKSNATTGLLIHDVDNTNKKLVVNFVGGPLGDPIHRFPSNGLNILYKLRKDTITVAAPASLGSTHSNSVSLSGNPRKSLKHSTNQIYHWIDNIGYDDVMVVGNSFGAIHAYALAQRLGKKLSKLILIVPKTKFEIDKSLGGVALQNAHPKQVAFESLVFGDKKNRKKLKKLYTKVFSHSCIKDNILVFYAEDDRLIDWKDRPLCLREDKNIIVLPNIGHNDINFDSYFKQRIQEEMIDRLE